MFAGAFRDILDFFGEFINIISDRPLQTAFQIVCFFFQRLFQQVLEFIVAYIFLDLVINLVFNFQGKFSYFPAFDGI